MNSIILIGRLTRDPEFRKVGQDGISTCRFTLAVDKGLSREKRQAFEAQNKPTADFINCVAWRGAADTIHRYVKKGNELAVQGRLVTGSYTNDQGQRVYTSDVQVNEFSFIGSRPKQENRGQAQASSPNPASPKKGPADQGTQVQIDPAQALDAMDGMDVGDLIGDASFDDLPF